MIRDALRDHLSGAAADTGFEPALDLLVAEARECVYMLNDAPASADQVGASRMGGLPDLLAGAQWPKGRGREGKREVYADFLAQVNWGDIPLMEGMALPRQGHLRLFLTDLPNVGEIRVAAIHDAAPVSQLALRNAPTQQDWVLGSIVGRTGLRFELGVSLPFGRTMFRQALDEKSDYAPWQSLAEALEPPDRVGQMGGFAYTADGSDLTRDVVLARLGRRDCMATDQYDTISELEDAARRVPPRVRNEEQLAQWHASFEVLRPQVQFIERHREEIAQWRPLVRFDTNREVGFDIGYHLWVFGRLSDVAQGDFGTLAAMAEH